VVINTNFGLCASIVGGGVCGARGGGGPIVRMDEKELTKKVLWANPGGQRGRGRPISR
jgi:hypothetical protein